MILFDFIPNILYAFSNPDYAREYGLYAAPWLIFIWLGLKEGGYLFSIWEPFNKSELNKLNSLEEKSQTSQDRYFSLNKYPDNSNHSSKPTNLVSNDLTSKVDKSNNNFEYKSLEDEFVMGSNGVKIQQKVNKILLNSFQENNSDIHIEPKEDQYKIRVRKDGVMQNYMEISLKEGKQIVACLKNMAQMDVAEKRASQDGKILTINNNCKLEFRCSTVADKFGESMVLRLLRSDKSILDLDSLIYIKSVRDSFRKVIRLMNGIIIVSGPTGSGKSTTLAAALREIDNGDLKIVTIEDPIEYDLGGDIVQSQVNRSKGQTFPNLLRTFLRHDPDVILIGETRDPETAISAMDASETGHLVFSTLHANTSSSSLIRLLDMEVPKYKLNISVRAVLAQRLLRKVCTCCIEKEIAEKDALLTGIAPGTFINYETVYNPEFEDQDLEVCQTCQGLGYNGRIGVYELLIINRKIQEAISEGKNHLEIQDIAENVQGMMTLRDYGIELIKAKLTTVSELERVCKAQEIINN